MRHSKALTQHYRKNESLKITAPFPGKTNSLSRWNHFGNLKDWCLPHTCWYSLKSHHNKQPRAGVQLDFVFYMLGLIFSCQNVHGKATCEGVKMKSLHDFKPDSHNLNFSNAAVWILKLKYMQIFVFKSFSDQ